MHYPEQLLWVPMQKPADIKDVKTMQKIRSHAQREVRRRERESKPQRLAENSKVSRALHFDVINGETRNQATSDGESPKELEELDILPKAVDMSHNALSVASDSLNPFAEALLLQPLRLYQMISRCICLWHSEQAARVCGGGPHGRWQSWMPFVVTNDTVLYAQAFSATVHYQVWSRHIYTAEALALKDQAVTRINHSLNNSADAVSDATLASVLCLAFATHIEGLGKANYLTHMNGLKRMIELKGGWDTVCSNELLGDTLEICDYLGAIINRSKLIYVPSGVPSSQEASQVPPLLAQTSPLLDSITPFQTPSTFNIPQSTLQIIENMRETTRTFFTRNGTSNVRKKGLRDSLSYHIQEFCSPEQDILTGTVEEKMGEALHLTATLYALALTHDLPFGRPENRKPIRLLQQLIESTILVGWTNLPGALLWVLLVGTAAERDCGEENIIAGYLSAISVCIGLRHWDAVRKILLKFLAIEDLLDERAGRVPRH